MPLDTATPEPGLLFVPAVLDIEASGFGRDSFPVEVGFVLPDGETFCTLIRPAAGWTHWDDSAERLRGMTLYCDG